MSRVRSAAPTAPTKFGWQTISSMSARPSAARARPASAGRERPGGGAAGAVAKNSGLLRIGGGDVGARTDLEDHGRSSRQSRRRLAGELAAGQAAGGDRLVVHVVEGPSPVAAALASSTRKPYRSKPKPLARMPSRLTLVVEEPRGVAGLADVAAGADDQLRRPIAGEREAGEVVDVAADHHVRRRVRSRPRAAACSVALIGSLEQSGRDLADRQAPDRPVGDDPGRRRRRRASSARRAGRRTRPRRSGGALRQPSQSCRARRAVSPPTSTIIGALSAGQVSGVAAASSSQNQPGPPRCAVLVIAAHHHPGRGAQQRRGGLRRSRRPRCSSCRPRGCRRSRRGRPGRRFRGSSSRRRGSPGRGGGRRPGARPGERPLSRVVAVLHLAALQPAAGVAEDHDAPAAWRLAAAGRRRAAEVAGARAPFAGGSAGRRSPGSRRLGPRALVIGAGLPSTDDGGTGGALAVTSRASAPRSVSCTQRARRNTAGSGPAPEPRAGASGSRHRQREQSAAASQV